MKIKQFKDILNGKEGTLVEFMKSFSSAIGKEICAFAIPPGGGYLSVWTIIIIMSPAVS
jgi:hypothetical protein